MDEIKIWAVDDSGVAPVQPASAIVSEELLEKTLVSHPQLLMPGLRLVGRQTPTEGGPLDLLGVDEDGRLVVFELKRGTLSRDAVAQVIDYASYLDSLDDDSLSQHIAGYSGHGGIDKIDDFGEWYSENIRGDGLESLRPVRMYLVGLGVDDRTERMVNFLAKSSRMDISLLTFYGYNYGDKTLLARQVRVSEPEPVKPTTGVVELANAHGVHGLFFDVRQTIEHNWTGQYDHVQDRKTSTNMSAYTRTESGRLVPYSYGRIEPRQDGVKAIFYGRAIELSPEAFRRSMQEISNITVPANVKNDFFDRIGGQKLDWTSVWVEIQFQLTAAHWAEHKESFSRLTRGVYEALQEKNRRGPSVVLEAEYGEQVGAEPTP